jgi:hypothetical protein
VKKKGNVMKMSGNYIVMLIGIICFQLMAQDEQTHSTIPPPLDDPFVNWLIGEWEGETTSAVGKTTDHVKYELGLNGQFLIMTFESKTVEGRSFSGIGAVTLDKVGNSVGYWIDSWRTMSEGNGFREGNLSTMKWSTNEGLYIRTTEKIDENTMRVSGSMTDPSGQEMRSDSNYKRVIK